MARKRNVSVKGHSSINRLDPSLDNDGIVRVVGRIRRAARSSSIKHPAILPTAHHVTKLAIRHFHQQTALPGLGLTTNDIRFIGFWIIGFCSVKPRLQAGGMSENAWQCPQTEEGRPTEDRLTPAPPFS